MPFYNIPATEAAGIADYGERSKDPKTGSGDTAFLDHVVRLVERRLYRYALTQTKATTDELQEEVPNTHTTTEEKEEGEEEEKVAHVDPSVTVERPMPYPSLFLNTPHAVVRCSWASRSDSKARYAAAEPLRRTLPAPPPSYLLATAREEDRKGSGADTKNKNEDGKATSPEDKTAKSPASVGEKDASASGVPDWADPHHLANAHQPPHLSGEGAQTLATAAEMPGRNETRLPYTLDLSRDQRARERVNVVLQGEAGLAVSAPPIVSTPAATPRPDTFLMSPDATSCTIVACRVTLHPRWQCRETGDAATVAFIEACVKTVTASMAHFDAGSDATETALYEMIWRAAIPAWLHAMAEQYTRTIKASRGRGGDEKGTEKESEAEGTQKDEAQVKGVVEEDDDARGAATFCDARLRLVEDALALLQASLVPITPTQQQQQQAGEEDDALPDPSRVVLPQDAPLSLLHVEWYVMGGVRMRQHAGPTLGRIFRSFFPPPLSSSAVLKTDVALAELLSHGKSTSAAEATSRLTVQHRLREDGVCFWSLNTYVSHWDVDTQNPQRRYAFPMCIGLLVRLRDGASWPVKIAPGTRNYPLARLRSVLNDGVRWTAPIEVASSANAQQYWRTHGSHSAAQRRRARCGELVTGLLTATTFAAATSKVVDARLAYLSKGPASGAGGNQSSNKTRLIALSWYVHRCLTAFASWCADDGDNEAEAAAAATTYCYASSHVPFVLRCQGSWSELDTVRNAHLLTMPDVFFLQFSTTPHCEPEDFGAQTRENCVTMMTWKNKDIFTQGTDGVLVE